MKVFVVGAINLDIGGQPAQPLLRRDSNIGCVRMTPGGVGHNIAANLAALGAETQLAAVLGSDTFSAALKEHCKKAGILLDYAVFTEGPSGIYLYVNDAEGDMFVAVNDMRSAALLTPDRVDIAAVNKGDACVLDCNISRETMEFVVKNARVPLIADPVSVAKCSKLCGLLPGIHTIKPNIYEAQQLTGQTEPESAARALLKLGVTRAFISLGAEGMAYAEGDAFGIVRPAPLVPVSTTGAGDSATAALTMALLSGMDAKSSAECACRVASLTIMSTETVSPELTPKLLEAK